MSHLSIGIQLYTVRDALKENFSDTLRALAGMGYQGVEFAWEYGGMAPNELACFLETIGLKVIGLHTSPTEILNPESMTYAYARALNCRYLTVSLAGEVERDWPGAIQQVSTAAAAAKANGFIFTYHNHDTEFRHIEGAHALDILYKQTDPELVQCELDTYWIAKGGEDPIAYMHKYAKRIPLLHIKDMHAQTHTFTEVGEGMLDWPAIFAVARAIGIGWAIVEQDVCAGLSLESANTSIMNLRGLDLI